MLRAIALLAFLLPVPRADAPAYTGNGEFVLPAHYRDWIFLSSGFDMSYARAATPATGAAPAATGVPAHSTFDNVFVNPSSYRAFQQTGHWPEGTILVLEARMAVADISINKQGRTQAEGVGLEVHVKDSKHTPGDGWSFYSFDGSPNPQSRIAQSAACYSCHQQHAAVDTTFTQFYPTLLPIAKAKHTLSDAYLADKPTP